MDSYQQKTVLMRVLFSDGSLASPALESWSRAGGLPYPCAGDDSLRKTPSRNSRSRASPKGLLDSWRNCPPGEPPSAQLLGERCDSEGSLVYQRSLSLESVLELL